MTQRTLAQLTDAMKGVPTTNGWDMIVSYSEEQLNHFLAANYQRGTLAKQVKLSTTGTNPITAETFRIDYTINFDSPEMTFVSGRFDVVNLDMSIGAGSTYSVTPHGVTKPVRTAEIPANKYTVRAVVPLASLSGDTGAVANQGKVITFTQGEVSSNHIVIHFRNQKGALFEIQPPPPKDTPDNDLLTTYFLPKLKEYFQEEVNEIDYALATLNNKIPATGATLFTPSSFAFAATGDDSITCLSLFIQTAQSGNPAGNPSPSFQPNDIELAPVPTGYTASIIMSHAFFTQSFLKAQLEKLGFTVKIKPVTEGASLSLQKNVSIINQGKTDNYIFDNISYDGLSISLKDHPLTLGIASGKAAMDWEGQTTSSWSEVTAGMGSVGGHVSYGTVNVTIAAHKPPIAVGVGDKGITFPSFSFRRSDFTVHTKSKSCSFLDRLVGCLTTVPSFYSDHMTLEIPSLDFALIGFDYFRETNLLSPSKQLINVDSTAGLQTPHDFLTVGNVKAS